MKKLIFISLLFSILSLSVSAQKPTKAEKAAQLEQEFQQTRPRTGQGIPFISTMPLPQLKRRG